VHQGGRPRSPRGRKTGFVNSTKFNCFGGLSEKRERSFSINFPFEVDWKGRRKGEKRMNTKKYLYYPTSRGKLLRKGQEVSKNGSIKK